MSQIKLLKDCCYQGKPISLLVMDVDGVLTDGKIFLGNAGQELKGFHTQDGQGLKLLREAGIKLGIITGRKSKLVEHRAKELGITYLYQGCHNKLQALAEILEKSRCTVEQTAYIGDDLPDIPVINKVTLGIAPANANQLVKDQAKAVTFAKGGEGAVRELCEFILKSQGLWQKAIEKYIKPSC